SWSCEDSVGSGLKTCIRYISLRSLDYYRKRSRRKFCRRPIGQTQSSVLVLRRNLNPFTDQDLGGRLERRAPPPRSVDLHDGVGALTSRTHQILLARTRGAVS